MKLDEQYLGRKNNVSIRLWRKIAIIKTLPVFIVGIRIDTVTDLVGLDIVLGKAAAIKTTKTFENELNIKLKFTSYISNY